MMRIALIKQISLKEGEHMKQTELNQAEALVLSEIRKCKGFDRYELAARTGYSLGRVNKLLKQLKEKGCLSSDNRLTGQAEELFCRSVPKNAVILAAGFGMRMVPINTETSKALLEVKGERLIDRLICQLHDAGVHDITVVTGFMKDSFEYLIDEYGADIVYNPDYSVKNNLFSLYRVLDKIGDTYIIPCDLYCRNNPFRSCELVSRYVIGTETTGDSMVRAGRNGVLQRTRGKGNRMYGICYLRKEDAAFLRKRVMELVSAGNHDRMFWEEALFSEGAPRIFADIAEPDDITEINTYEQLRDFDHHSEALQSDAIETICRKLHAAPEEIRNILVLKKGMTNRSFLFTVHDCQYIMRIPGEGTDQLIDRRHEAEVFRTIHGKGLCDDPVYIDEKTGYKITRYLTDVRTCDPFNDEDLKRCMRKLKEFHEMKLSVGHCFDLFGQIMFYESLWNGNPSVYRDYEQTKADVFLLKDYLDKQQKDLCLTHIDAVCDNFLFYQENGEEKLQLTDWEYAGMQDPHVDIAMFCIYSMYSREQVDHLIDLYFEGSCTDDVRLKIKCYIAVCGLLWSNWCEYKRQFGVEFGEYSLRQYRFAKDYSRYVLSQTGIRETMK